MEPDEAGLVNSLPLLGRVAHSYRAHVGPIKHMVPDPDGPEAALFTCGKGDVCTRCGRSYEVVVWHSFDSYCRILPGSGAWTMRACLPSMRYHIIWRLTHCCTTSFTQKSAVVDVDWMAHSSGSCSTWFRLLTYTVSPQAATLVSADAGNIHLWNAEGGKEVGLAKTALVLMTVFSSTAAASRFAWRCDRPYNLLTAGNVCDCRWRPVLPGYTSLALLLFNR